MLSRFLFRLFLFRILDCKIIMVMIFFFVLASNLCLLTTATLAMLAYHPSVYETLKCCCGVGWSELVFSALKHALLFISEHRRKISHHPDLPSLFVGALLSVKYCFSTSATANHITAGNEHANWEWIKSQVSSSVWLSWNENRVQFTLHKMLTSEIPKNVE